MDRVIYLQFSAGQKLLSYAIGDQEAQSDEEIDSIRKLDLPQLDYKLVNFSVAVVNSRLYLMGGTKTKIKGYFQTEMGKRSTQDLDGYLSLDLLAASPNWLASDGGMDYPAHIQHSAAVSEQDGSIYTLGCEQGRFLCSTPGDAAATWEEVPAFFDILPTEEEGGRFSSFARLLALTENKLFGSCATNLICYDLVTREWKLIDKDFEGKWASGIVVEESYLISFGKRTRDTPAAVYVYDIGRREWLPENGCPEPVEGLGPNDGTVLPGKGLGEEYRFGRMWRVGMVDGHPKMALVWSRESPSTKSSEVHWSKFVLRRGDNNAQAPNFSADLLSHGVFSVYDTEATPTLVNGTAGLSS